MFHGCELNNALRFDNCEAMACAIELSNIRVSYQGIAVPMDSRRQVSRNFAAQTPAENL